MVRHFLDDDIEYQIWLAGHPSGYVVNCERHPKPNYLVLHRADRTTINGTPSHGGRWTHDYRKVCAATPVELEAWARDTIRTTPSRCGVCQP